MPSYHYDQLQFSSVLPSYINTGQYPATLVVPAATIASGGDIVYRTHIAVPAGFTFLDVYVTSAAGVRVKLNGDQNAIGNIFTYAGFEVTTSLVFFSTTDVQVVLGIENNDVNPVTLIAQTFAIEVLAYDIPFGLSGGVL